jgi:hypothetical protein
MLTQLSRMSSIRNRIGPNKLKYLNLCLTSVERRCPVGGGRSRTGATASRDGRPAKERSRE